MSLYGNKNERKLHEVLIVGMFGLWLFDDGLIYVNV